MNRREVVAGLAMLPALGSCASSSPLRVFDHGGAALFYREAGNGALVVFVHGGMQDYRLWDPIFPEFSQRYRVVAYSRRNHFPGAVSADGAPDGAADLHGEDLAALIAFLGGPAHVVAHSAGAHAALFCAARQPALTRTLSLCEPPASGLLQGDAIARAFAATLSPARAAFSRGDIDAGMRLFADAVGGAGEYERRDEAARRMMRDNIDAHIADATTARPRPVFDCATAALLRAPMLLVTGSRSPAYFHAIADQLARCAPAVQREQVEGASHSVPAEAPRAFAERVLAFLAAHP